MARTRAIKRKYGGNGAAHRRMKAPRLSTYIPPPGRGMLREGGFYGRFTGARSTEKKFFDQDVNDAVVAAGGTIVSPSLLTIAQGTTESTRIGRKVFLKGLFWKYDVSLPVSAGGGGQIGDTVRVILYVDQQTNGAAAGVTDLLESNDYQSFYNLANSQRFRILHDKVHDLNMLSGAGNGTANDYSEVRRSYKYNKFLSLPVEYNSTTGAIGEIRSNNIGVLLVGRSGTAEFASKMRIRFTD